MQVRQPFVLDYLVNLGLLWLVFIILARFHDTLLISNCMNI